MRKTESGLLVVDELGDPAEFAKARAEAEASREALLYFEQARRDVERSRTALYAVPDRRTRSRTVAMTKRRAAAKAAKRARKAQRKRR